jgi:hypothetical protein
VPAALRSLFGESTRTHYAGAGGLHLIITLAQQALPQHLRTQLRDGSELSSLPPSAENSYCNDSYSAGDAPVTVAANILDRSAWLRVVAHTVRQLRQLDSSGVLPRGGHVSSEADGESLVEVDDGCDDSYAAAAAHSVADERDEHDDNGSSNNGQQWSAEQQHAQQQQQQQQRSEQQRSSQRAPSRDARFNNNSIKSRNRGRSAPPARSRSKGASARLSNRSAAQRPYASSASPERAHYQQQQQQQQRYYSHTGQFTGGEHQRARTRLHHTDGAKRGTRPAGLFEVTRPPHERVARSSSKQQQQQPQYLERVTSRIGQQLAADRQAQQATAKAQRAAALDAAARHR